MGREDRPLADAIVAGALLAVGIILILVSRREAAGVTERDLVGQDGFPIALGATIVLCTSYLLIRSLWRWRQQARADAGDSVSKETDTVFAWQPLALWLLSVLYLVSLTRVGFAVSTAVYVFLGRLLLGSTKWQTAAVISIGTTLVLYGIFSWFLRVSLPTGFVGI